MNEDNDDGYDEEMDVIFETPHTEVAETPWINTGDRNELIELLRTPVVLIVQDGEMVGEGLNIDDDHIVRNLEADFDTVATMDTNEGTMDTNEGIITGGNDRRWSSTVPDRVFAVDLLRHVDRHMFPIPAHLVDHVELAISGALTGNEHWRPESFQHSIQPLNGERMYDTILGFQLAVAPNYLMGIRFGFPYQVWRQWPGRSWLTYMLLIEIFGQNHYIYGSSANSLAQHINSYLPYMYNGANFMMFHCVRPFIRGTAGYGHGFNVNYHRMPTEPLSNWLRRVHGFPTPGESRNWPGYHFEQVRRNLDFNGSVLNSFYFPMRWLHEEHEAYNRAVLMENANDDDDDGISLLSFNEEEEGSDEGILWSDLPADGTPVNNLWQGDESVVEEGEGQPIVIDLTGDVDIVVIDLTGDTDSEV